MPRDYCHQGAQEVLLVEEAGQPEAPDDFRTEIFFGLGLERFHECSNVGHAFLQVFDELIEILVAWISKLDPLFGRLFSLE